MNTPEPIADPADEFVEISRQCAAPASPAGAFWSRYDEMLAELDRRGERIAAALAVADEHARLARENNPGSIDALDPANADDINEWHFEAGLNAAHQRAADDLRRALTEETPDQLCRHLAHEIRSALAEPSGDIVQASESPTDSTPKAGRGGSSEAETATGAVQAPDAAALLRSYRDVERVCTGLGLTGWDGGWRNDRVTVYGPRGPEDEEDEVSVFGPHTEHVATVPMGAPAVVLDVWLRVLLAADTTPDRLAWISEAGETAAVERQARYQETACALRPAEERPDV